MPKFKVIDKSGHYEFIYAQSREEAIDIAFDDHEFESVKEVTEIKVNDKISYMEA